jgi:hypothetical protein
MPAPAIVCPPSDEELMLAYAADDAARSIRCCTRGTRAAYIATSAPVRARRRRGRALPGRVDERHPFARSYVPSAKFTTWLYRIGTIG